MLPQARAVVVNKFSVPIFLPVPGFLKGFCRLAESCYRISQTMASGIRRRPLAELFPGRTVETIRLPGCFHRSNRPRNCRLSPKAVRRGAKVLFHHTRRRPRDPTYNTDTLESLNLSERSEPSGWLSQGRPAGESRQLGRCRPARFHPGAFPGCSPALVALPTATAKKSADIRVLLNPRAPVVHRADPPTPLHQYNKIHRIPS